MCMRSGRPERALRTTAAPKSTALGADGAHSAGPTGVQPAVSTADVELPSAIPAFVEAHAKLAAKASSGGGLRSCFRHHRHGSTRRWQASRRFAIGAAVVATAL